VRRAEGKPVQKTRLILFLLAENDANIVDQSGVVDGRDRAGDTDGRSVLRVPDFSRRGDIDMESRSLAQKILLVRCKYTKKFLGRRIKILLE
jgi:hypothetical protein